VYTAPELGERRHQLARHLYYSLLTHLAGAGVTVTHASIDDADATWRARDATLTLRADAELEDHIAAMGDLTRMITLREPSARGAYPLAPPRHLTAVPTSA